MSKDSVMFNIKQCSKTIKWNVNDKSSSRTVWESFLCAQNIKEKQNLGHILCLMSNMPCQSSALIFTSFHYSLAMSSILSFVRSFLRHVPNLLFTQIPEDSLFHCRVMYEDSMYAPLLGRQELQENVGIYLEENYEQINVPVPNFGGSDPADIVHDFHRVRRESPSLLHSTSLSLWHRGSVFIHIYIYKWHRNFIMSTTLTFLMVQNVLPKRSPIKEHVSSLAK